MSAKTNHHVICVGYPNAGKTSSFNRLTKTNFQAVNYPGSTVQFNKATTHHQSTITWIDTPGIITFIPHSDDEKVTHKALTNLTALDPSAPQYPDHILYIVDVLQLARHMMGYFVLKEKGYPITLIITRADSLKKQKGHLDIKQLSRELNAPVFFGNANTGEGLPTIQQIETILTHSTPYIPSLEENTTHWKAASQKANTLSKKVLTIPPYQSKTDKVFLHPFFGGLLFITIMSLFFFLIFLGATPLMDAIDLVWGGLIEFATASLPESKLTEFLVDGILANIGAVIIFLPQIFLLFFATGILETTGYLARAAVIIDRPLSWIGLSGKSFVPILSGAACAIPAILAARTLNNRTQKWITYWMIPLMPCAARLPVYGLLLAILFKGDPLKSALGLVAIYFISLTIAILVAKLLTLKWKNPDPSFYIEIPRWQLPYWPSIFKNAYKKSIQFLQKAGPAILAISVILWALSQYPSTEAPWLNIIGKVLEPLFSPMGWDWRIGVAVLASFAAREVFVSVLATLIFSGEDQVIQVLTQTQILSTPSILALITFFIISLQCGSTIVVLKKEIGSWKMPITMTATYIVLAYTAAIMVYKIAEIAL